MEDKKKDLKESIVRKKAIEDEIAAIGKQLEQYKGTNYGGELVDEEGFPHKDLDYETLRIYKELKRRQNGKLSRAQDEPVSAVHAVWPGS